MLGELDPSADEDRAELREAVEVVTAGLERLGEAIVRDLLAEGFCPAPGGGVVLRGGGDVGRLLLYLAGEHGPPLRRALPALAAAAELSRAAGPTFPRLTQPIRRG